MITAQDVRLLFESHGFDAAEEAVLGAEAAGDCDPEARAELERIREEIAAAG